MSQNDSEALLNNEGDCRKHEAVYGKDETCTIEFVFNQSKVANTKQSTGILL